MTYTTDDALGRKALFGAPPDCTVRRDKADDLKQTHLRRLNSPPAPARSQHDPRLAAAKHSYDISVLKSDGSTGTGTHLAPAKFYLEDICACFGRGTLIATTTGQTAIEDLRPGDHVKTKDNGAIRLRWIASCDFGGPDTTSDATGFAIRIKAGALGDHRPVQDLVVSPRFRVLTNHTASAVLFGSAETLAPARDLTDDQTIMQIRPPADMRFYNLMFDSHQIIQANGLETESYHPGNYGFTAMSLEMLHHLRQIFPHLDGNLSGFGQTVRPILKRLEADASRFG